MRQPRVAGVALVVDVDADVSEVGQERSERSAGVDDGDAVDRVLGADLGDGRDRVEDDLVILVGVAAAKRRGTAGREQRGEAQC